MSSINAVNDVRTFNRFYTNIIGVIDRHILDSPYSLTEARILYEIYNNHTMTARKIKKYLHIDEGYLSHTLEKMIKNGLLIRQKSKDDRRLNILSLTQKGETDFLALSLRSEHAIASLIKDLTGDELERLTAAMREITFLLTKEE